MKRKHDATMKQKTQCNKNTTPQQNKNNDTEKNADFFPALEQAELSLGLLYAW